MSSFFNTSQRFYFAETYHDPGIFTAIGVDDWAYKKRERYGSILVHLTTRRVVDLLPDREEFNYLVTKTAKT